MSLFDTATGFADDREVASMSTHTAESAYDFTVDWFSYNIPTWDHLLSQLKPRRIVEIGCYEGRSSTYLIEKCAAMHDIELHCIDTWDGGEEFKKGAFGGRLVSDAEARFDHNVAQAIGKAQHEVLLNKHKTSSNKGLVHILASGEFGGYDLVYIDGSHQAADVLADAVLSFELLRVGGLMIFDDYLWCMEADGFQDSLGMAKPAIDAFTNIYQRKMKIVAGCPIYQLYAHKTHP